MVGTKKRKRNTHKEASQRKTEQKQSETIKGDMSLLSFVEYDAYGFAMWYRWGISFFSVWSVISIGNEYLPKDREQGFSASKVSPVLESVRVLTSTSTISLKFIDPILSHS